MSINLTLDKDLVITDLKSNNYEDILQILSHKLYKKGYVKKEYIEAILEREQIYPTGLPSTPPAIAIPHSNNELVNTTTFAIATMKKPVNFHNMEDPKEEIPVQIVIMLAIAEPHGQIEMLQKVVEIIQDEDFRKKMVNTTDENELLEIVKTKLL